MEPLFQSQTEYTFEEFKRYNREILYNVKNVKKTIFMFRIILLILGVVTRDLTYIFGSLVVPVIFNVTFSFQEKRNYKKNEKLHNMMMYHRFYEDYIEQESKLGTVTIFHYQISDVLETETNFYLLTANNGAIMVVKDNCTPEHIEYLVRFKESKMRM